MKNQFLVEGDVVRMLVQGEMVIFDAVDLPVVERFGQWKLWKGNSVYTDFRDAGKMCKITLHKLLTGSKFVRWINENAFDFRRENMTPVEKGIRNRPCGVNLKGNAYRTEKDAVVVMIASKGKIYEAYTDPDDYPLISGYTWNINSLHGYAQTRERLGRDNLKPIFMHRLVMGAQGFIDVVDHINGNKLDNRKANLRVCSRSANYHNNYKMRNGELVGVARTKCGTTWEAFIMINNFHHHKIFKTKDEAIVQRKQWEAEFNPTGLSN
jgi:hypothetical protein